MGRYCVISCLILLCLCDIRIAQSKDVGIHSYFDGGGVMLVSTIDGYVTAIDAKTGAEKWKFKEAPVLESSVEIEHGFTFIPNPTNGQLYYLMEGHLSKLPFTIPELVRVSPCRSLDGILYAGSKKDVWISINPETGERAEAFSSPNSNSFCPVSHSRNVFVGKTEYHLSMLDTRFKHRQWNATFVDYTSHLLPADTNYPYQHYTTSSDGWLVTVDIASGNILWKREFRNVIVNMYWMKNDGMHKLPSTAFGRETFETILEASAKKWKEGLMEKPIESSKTYQNALYVGQTTDVGLYALSAFVDSKTPIAPAYVGPPLLEGPSPIKPEVPEASKNNARHFWGNKYQLVRTYKEIEGEYLLLGYHQPPPLRPNNLVTINGLSQAATVLLHHIQNTDRYPQIELGIEYDESSHIIRSKKYARKSKQNNPSKNLLIADKREDDYYDDDDEWTFEQIVSQIWRKYPYSLIGIIAGIFALLITTIWLCGRHSALTTATSNNANNNQMTLYEISQSSRSSRGSKKSWFSTFMNSNSLRRLNSKESTMSDASENIKIVGKMWYNRNRKLGQGGAGTAVYEGVFDNRKVAVKRVMRENFDLVEREISLLRESDHHPNVIRYFCSETDNDFGYIALELCEASLDDYVKIPEIRERYLHLSKLEILKQTSDGIAHLHSLSFVHRDVKPRNILLLKRFRDTRVHVVISDFGLCKAIQVGHNSVSKTGIVGTEGWIAPEMINQNTQTCAVDIFALGCVFYYVLSDGEHPFGSSLQRQERIANNYFDLSFLTQTSNFVAEDLIKDMLNEDFSRRPKASAVMAHPIFWSKERQLQFFMNVSDRIEKELEDAITVKQLERNVVLVIGRSWFNQLSEPLQQDLRKFRAYKHYSVRDLLRAMRNKHHHYQELSEELKNSLGDIPDGYITYFTTIFPKLLMHVYTAMTVCGGESIFSNYYPTDLRTFYTRKLVEDEEFLVRRRVLSPRIARRTDSTKGNLPATTSATTINAIGGDRALAKMPTSNSVGEIFQQNISYSENSENWRSKPPLETRAQNESIADTDNLAKNAIMKLNFLPRVIRNGEVTTVPAIHISKPNGSGENQQEIILQKHETLEAVDARTSSESPFAGSLNTISSEISTEADDGSNNNLGEPSALPDKTLKSKSKKRKRKKSARAPLSILSELDADEDFSLADQQNEECAGENVH